MQRLYIASLSSRTIVYKGLMLATESEASGERSGFAIYFQTPDLDGTFVSLAARGARIASEPHLVARMPDHELWMAFVRDPDGQLIGLMQERR